jgi:hypothetical protein
LKKNEREVLEGVARRFSATWEYRNDAGDVDLRLAGRPVAVHLATLQNRGTGGAAARIRLRFDKVARRLIERLQNGTGRTVPEGAMIVLTVTAPIRLASKTAAALEARLPALSDGGSPGRDRMFTIHGNRVRVRVLTHVSARAPRLIGFVHNADSDPVLLMNLAGEWVRLLNVQAGTQRARPAGGRWLVVTSVDGMSSLQAHQYIWSQLPMPGGTDRILIAAGDGRVEVLKSR